MSGAVIIQQGNGEQIDLSAMIQSAVTNAITEVDQQRRVQSKRGRSDRGTGSERLGYLLRSYREHYEFTQSELARRAGVHPTTISKIEDGERGMSMQTLARLSPLLGIYFTRKVLKEYDGRPDDIVGGDTIGGPVPDPAGLHPGTWREAGGPEPEHPVPQLGGVATETAGGDEAGD